MNVLILGITGAFGQSVAEILLAQDPQTVSFPLLATVRSVSKAKRLFPKTPDTKLVFLEGDVQSKDNMSAKGVGRVALDYIVFGINYGYAQWDPLMYSALERVIALAKETNATIVFPGNVYNLKPVYDTPLKEDHACEPITKKGRIRQKMEDMIRDSKVRCLNVRASDFFGPSLKNPFQQMLFENPLKLGRSIMWVRAMTGRHEWVVLPDLANAVAQLMVKHHASPKNESEYEVFHFKGIVADNKEVVKTIQQEVEAINGKKVGCIALPWWLLKINGLVDSDIAEFIELRYLKDNNVELSNEKLTRFLPALKPLTSLQESVRLTLKSFNSN